MVIAVMARVTGGRAESCETAVPSLTCLVRDPHQANGVHASLPYASADQIWSNSSRSASSNSCPAPAGGPELQYPAVTAIFIGLDYPGGPRSGLARPPGWP